MKKRGLSGNNLNKRGLSEVVTTLLFVLFALMAVLLVWFVVKNLISGTSKNVGLEEFSANLEIPGQNIYVDGVLKSVSFIVQRGAGEGIINAVQIVLESSDGQSSSVRYDFAGGLNALDSKAVSASFASLNDLKKVSIAPIISTSDGTERTGSVAASASIPAESVHGSVLSFDGVNDRVALSGINLKNDVSISVWAKVDAGVNCNSNVFNAISMSNPYPLSGYGTNTVISGGAGIENGFYLTGSTCGTFGVKGSSSTNNKFLGTFSPSGINSRQWSHYVYVSSVSKGYFYINGNLVRTSDDITDRVTYPYTPFDETGQGLMEIGHAIGDVRTDGNSNDYYFQGQIKDVRIFSKALSPEEVSALYAGDNLGAVASSNLAGWWKLDEGTGTTAFDSSGRGNNGVINGNANWI